MKKTIKFALRPSRRDPDVINYELYVDDVMKDSGYDNQLGYMIYRVFGYNLEGFDFDTSVPQKIIKSAMKQYESMISIDDEIPSKDYRRFLKAYEAGHDFNETCAQKMAYNDFNELVKAGFNHSFAFDMAFFKALLLMSPEKDEVMEILNLKYEYISDREVASHETGEHLEQS